MQRIDFNKISKNITDIINRALNFSYNSNSGKLDYSQAESLIPQNNKVKFEISGFKFEIKSSKPLCHMLKIENRIPQSRLHITYLQGRYFLIRVIRYFNRLIVLGESYDSASCQEIYFSSDEKKLNVQYPKMKQVDDNPIKIPIVNGFIAQIGEINQVDPAKLSDQVQSWIEKERVNHPISYLRYDNPDYLSEIDCLWSKIDYFDSNNSILIKKIEKNINNFIWLQEIYIHFGLYDKLNSFYKEIDNPNSKFQISSVMVKSFNRYKQTCKLSGKSAYQLKRLHKEDKFELDNQYLNYFFTNSETNEYQLCNQIQKTWDYLHIPAIQLKVQRLINQNPDEYIAYAILVLQYRFWWYENLQSMLLKYLPSDRIVLFKLLLMIKNADIVRFYKKSIYLSRYSGINHIHEFNNLLGFINKKETQNNKGYFSLVEKPNTFYLRINREVDIEYYPESNGFKIFPRLFTFFKEWDHNCKIELAGFDIQLPLIWDQITLEFNKCRFKFFRKKDRFQVTIKFFKSIKSIKINGTHIDNTSSPGIKFYLPIKRKSSLIYFRNFSVYGRDTHGLMCTLSKNIFRGYGINCFGILQTKFRLYYEDQHKSCAIDLNGKDIQTISVDRKTRMLELKGSKFDPVIIPVKFLNLLFEKITYADFMAIFNHLKICVEYGEEIISHILKACHDNIGIIPQIKYTTNILPDKNNYYLIIREPSVAKNYPDLASIIVQPINSKSSQNAIFINPDEVENLFTESFFRALSN